MGKKEINLGFHFQFLSIGKPRNGNKKSQLTRVFLLFCFSFSQEPNGGRLQGFSFAESGFVLCLGGGKKVRKEKKLMS